MLNPENTFPAIFGALGVIILSVAFYLAVRERRRTGNSEGLQLLGGLAVITVVLIAMAAISSYYPYWYLSTAGKSIRILLACTLPGFYFGYVFAYVTSLITVTSENRTYYRHFWGLFPITWTAWLVYVLVVGPVTKGLSTGFIGLGVLVGWMLAPFLLTSIGETSE